jgi:hypothetical protein
MDSFLLSKTYGLIKPAGLLTALQPQLLLMDIKQIYKNNNQITCAKRIRYLIIILAVLASTSCTTIEYFDTPELPHITTINCLMQSGQAIAIQLSSTSNIRKNDSTVQTFNIDLELYENDIQTSASYQQIAPNLYVFDHYAIPNNKYKIVVNNLENGNIIYAEDSIPLPTEITSIEHSYPVLKDIYGTIYGKTRLTFKDDPSKRNYYEMAIVEQNNLLMTIKITHPVVSVDSDKDFFINPTILFTDDLFNGEALSLDILTESYRPKVILRTVSSHYYLYKKHLYAHLNYINNSSSLLMSAEPVKMFSNIHGGLGIFAGYSETAKIAENN